MKDLTLTRGRRARRHLLIKAGYQMIASFGFVVLAAVSGSNGGGSIGVLISFLLASLMFCLGYRTLRTRATYKPQARGEKILRQPIAALMADKWHVIPSRYLPPDCRDYLVIYPPSDEIAFVIGLTGEWPDRKRLEEPQRIASELSGYGVEHVPVSFAAFVEGDRISYELGVVTATPASLIRALKEVEQSYLDEQEAIKEEIRLANLPEEVLAGRSPIEEDERLEVLTPEAAWQADFLAVAEGEPMDGEEAVETDQQDELKEGLI